jgi:NADPH2:quinone reductase
MRALICEAHGGPEVLKVGTLPEPKVGPGQLLIRVAAAGLNFADTLMVSGSYQEKPAFPFAPGLEVAGTIVEAGAGVTGLRKGQRVLAAVGHGGFAELAAADASGVFPLPDAMDFVTAAGFMVTYGTAHGALVWRAALKPGETLVVHGAAGGVGLAAVEVGKALGARVIATAGGADKLAVAKAHGADLLIDYKSEDLKARLKELAGPKGAEVHFDPVGGSAFDASLRAVAWEGRIVIVGFAGGGVPQIPANILLVKNASAIGFYWGSYRRQDPARLRAQFDDLFAWYAAGKLKPHVSHRLPLAAAAQGFELLRDRRATGKVVVEI